MLKKLVLAMNYFEDPFAFMGNLTYILTVSQRRELFLDPPFQRPGYALDSICEFLFFAGAEGASEKIFPSSLQIALNIVTLLAQRIEGTRCNSNIRF